MGHNPWLDQFLMFYSQSEAGNGLTRGLDTELSRRTYVPTKLDRELTAAILAKRYRLVILTGNAGDGKTAFLQKVEEAAEGRGAETQERSSLGRRFLLGGWTFKTLYDGSVESEATSNQEMLKRFFAEFAGDSPPRDHICLIIAVNEGKLRDFLSHTTGFGWLSRAILDHIQRSTPLPDDVVLVNLNLRSVVDASLSERDCLFDQILSRFVADEFWAPCDSCASRYRCPVKFNVDTFRVRPVHGCDERQRASTEARNDAARRARTRLKTIFQVLHFRKRVHVTVRDLRSVLAFALFGKKTCEEIERQVQEGGTDFTGQYYYNAIFDDQEKDRILAILREFDVGLCCSPRIDSRLSFTKPKTNEFRTLFNDFDDHRRPELGRSRDDENALLKLYEARPMSPEQRTEDALQASRQYVVALRRKLYFEGLRLDESGEQKPFLNELLPYDNVRHFFRFVETGEDQGGQLKSALVLAISRSENIYDEIRGRENICILTRHDPNTRVRAFFTYPAEHFTLELPDPGSQASFIEFLPSSIVLKHQERDIPLEISLDLCETLMRIRDGYIPAAGEMRAFFLNLLMFKKQLMATPSERLLLTESDYELYQLTKTPQNGIALSVV